MLGGLVLGDLYVTYLKSILEGMWVVWPLFALIAVVALGKLIYRFYEKKRLAESGIDDIDTMDGKTFEKYLEVLFLKLGYKVERTRYVGDYGADLVTAKNGVKTIIQAKRHKNKVGIKAIQEAVAAKGYYECQEAMVVTNSSYTKQATELALANKVKLWDRSDLVAALLSVKKDNVSEPTPEVCAAVETEGPEELDGSQRNNCVVCGQAVTEKVLQYCLDHAERFGGQIYCFQHQKGIKR